MGYADVLRRRSFGETMRRDAWWVQPLVTFLAFSAFIVYSTWAAFQGAHYRFGPYLSPFYSPEIFGDAEHELVRRQAGLVAGLVSLVRRPSSSSGPPAASASPATTTAAPTTRRSGPIRRPARWASRARAIAASAPFR